MNFIFNNIMIFLFKFLKHYVDKRIVELKNLCMLNLHVYSSTLKINQILDLLLILFYLFIGFLITHLLLKVVTCIIIFMAINLNILILLYNLCCVKGNIFSYIGVMFIRNLRICRLFTILIIFIEGLLLIMHVLIIHFIFISIFTMGQVIFIRFLYHHVSFSYEYIRLRYLSKFFNIFYIQKFFQHNLCEFDVHVFDVIIHLHQFNQLAILTNVTFIYFIYYKFQISAGHKDINL